MLRRQGRGPQFTPLFYKLLFMLALILVMLPYSKLLPASNHSPAPAAEVQVQATAAPAPKVVLPPLPDPDPVEWAVVKADSQVRTEADANTPVLLNVSAGDSFAVVHKTDDWIQIRLTADQTGWLPADQVTDKGLSDDQVQLVRNEAETALYRGPGEMFGKARDLAAGTALIPKQISGEWIELTSGAKGETPLWMKADQALWAFGPPPAQAVWSHVVRILSAAQDNPPQPLSGKVIVIDPGHGGDDMGAEGTTQPVEERDVNLAVAQVLAVKLKAAGAKVIMTRTANDQYVSLDKRVEISNDNHADAFVSIHQNIFQQDPDVSGTITYYYTDKSRLLARDIQDEVNQLLHSDEEQKDIDKEDYRVIKNNLRPAVLIEGCFLSNPQELAASVTPEYHEKLASGIFAGIVDFLN